MNFSLCFNCDDLVYRRLERWWKERLWTWLHLSLRIVVEEWISEQTSIMLEDGITLDKLGGMSPDTTGLPCQLLD